MPRIVACLSCNTIERMVDPPEDTRRVPATLAWDDNGIIREHTIKDEQTGLVAMVPEYDPIMEDYVGRHSHNLPDTMVIDNIKVWVCDQDTYDSLDAVEFVKEALAKQTDEMMTEVNYYKDEALKCYNAHKNPDTKTGCVDFLDDSKIIGSKQVPPKNRVYLCHMCPYMQTYVATEMRHKADLYKNPQKYLAAQRARQARMAMKQRMLRAKTRKNKK